MRRSRKGIAVMAIVIATQIVITIGASQVVSRIKVGRYSGSKFSFDHSNGGLEPNQIEFVFRSGLAGSGPIRVNVDTAVVVGSNRVPVIEVLGLGPVGIVPDGDYDASVRIRAGVHGNWSDESSSVQIQVFSEKPPSPTNFGVSG